MNTTQLNHPLVTVVVVPRESFNMFAEVVRGIYAVTPPIFKLLIMEGRAPDHVRDELRQIESLHSGCKIVYSDKWLYPHDFVNQSMPLIDTKYVVYVDNDVEVMEGWLENLVACAEEEKVGCVHPIYLTTKLNDPARKIHVAEGKLIRKKSPNGKWYIDSTMSYSGVRLEDYPDKRRKPSEFFEWHCVLFSKALLDKVGPLDDLNISEHLDYTFRLQNAGERILLEPKAVVAYEYDRIWRLRGEDREYLIFRWGVEKSAKSLARYAEKWDLEPESTARRLYWVKEHVAKVQSTYFLPRAINKVRRLVGLGNMPLVKEPRPAEPAAV